MAAVRNVTCVLASAALVAIATLPARGATLNDTYLGGNNTYNGSDVIGSNLFNIRSADVTRSRPGNGTLNITIHTNYAGAPGAPAAESTGYGSLFFSSIPFTPTGTPTSYPEDVYTANRWDYAFTMPAAPGTSSGSSALYTIGGNATAHVYGGGVADYYTTDNGKIYMSNVHGNPITANHPGNPGFYFREGQAVQYVPDDAGKPAKVGITDVTGTWEVIAGSPEGSITFTILDDGLLGNSFTLAWAMTCANDVFLETFTLRGGSDFPTPLPATVWLLGSVFAGGAGVGRWRKAKKARVATT